MKHEITGRTDSDRIRISYLALELYLFFVVVWCVPFRESGFTSVPCQHCPLRQGALERTDCRFWMRMKERTILILRALCPVCSWLSPNS